MVYFRVDVVLGYMILLYLPTTRWKRGTKLIYKNAREGIRIIATHRDTI